MALKSQFGLSRDAFDSMLTIFGSMLPEDHILPKTIYQATKILGALKMPYEHIHSCSNGFILFMKEHDAETYCPNAKPLGSWRWTLVTVSLYILVRMGLSYL